MCSSFSWGAALYHAVPYNHVIKTNNTRMILEKRQYLYEMAGTLCFNASLRLFAMYLASVATDQHWVGETTGQELGWGRQTAAGNWIEDWEELGRKTGAMHGAALWGLSTMVWFAIVRLLRTDWQENGLAAAWVLWVLGAAWVLGALGCWMRAGRCCPQAPN